MSTYPQFYYPVSDNYVKRSEVDGLLYSTVAVTNKATGGSIGSAATTVDIASTININQTTASQTLTIPNPTNTTANKAIYINNVGSTSFTLLSTIIAPGGGIVAVWNGTSYNVIGTSSGASNVTVVGGKTFTVNNTLTLAGTDGTTMTFPTTSATLARTDAANTFTGHQTIEGVTSTGATGTGNLVFSASPTFTGHITVEGVTPSGATGTGNLVFATSPTLTTPTIGVATATSVNKVALTAPASSATLTIADGKTLTANNSLTLAGTDSTTMTFPSTSATIARTDAANTFTGHQTIEGVTSTGATGTGRFVFDGTPTLVTPVIGAATGTSLRTSGGIGYTGIQEALTQSSSKSTTVTSATNSVSTVITSSSASLAGAATVSFTYANTSIAATDVVVVSVKSGASTGLYNAFVSATGTGTCQISITNLGSTASEAVVMNVVIFKAS